MNGVVKMNTDYDLRISDVLYEKSEDPRQLILFSNGSSISHLDSRIYPIENMIHKIQLIISIVKDGALKELYKHFNSIHAVCDIEYQSNEMPMYDFRGSRVSYPSPTFAVVTLEQGTIPYGFFSKYREEIEGIDIELVKVIPDRPSLSPSYQSYGFVQKRFVTLHPYKERDFFFDKEMKIHFNRLFIGKNNKEAKNQAQLQRIDD